MTTKSMEVFNSTITKEEINALPVESFSGRIIVIQTEADADKAVAYLFRYPLVGFDTETRPSFKKGQYNKVALMQISTEDTCFLFRLNYMGIPASLADFLCINALRKRMNIVPANFVDLQHCVKSFGIEELGLQKIYAILFGKKISKSQRLTNWDADVLTESQKKYAALDAWACLQIYKLLSKKGI